MIHFVAGLPRSGSTLLMNLLGQNPDFRVTPTSGLVDVVKLVRDNWMRNEAFRAEGLKIVEPRMKSAIRGLMEGYFADAGDRVVFDKARGWPEQIELLETVFERPIKVVTCVRDVRAIVASFEKLYRAHPMTRHPILGDAYYEAQTVEGRAYQLLHPKSVLGLSINRVRDAIQRGLTDRMVVVPYGQLVSSPLQVMDSIHRSLKLCPFEYDPNNVQQVTHEDDTVYGYNLHTIQPQIRPGSFTPWVGVLPDDLSAKIAERYADITALCH